MIRLGKFFRKQLGKFLRSSPPSNEVEERECEEVNKQVVKDFGPTAETSSLPVKAANDPAESSGNDCEGLLRITSTTLLQEKQQSNRDPGGFQSPVNNTRPVDPAAPESTSDDSSITQNSETRLSSSPAVTGITESVQALSPSAQSHLVSEQNYESKKSTHDIPIHITVPEFIPRSTAPTTKPENAADSAPQSSRSSRLTDSEELMGMISKSEHIPLPSKLSELPFDSTSLRSYLEKTSTRSPSSPQYVSPPIKNNTLQNKQAYISASSTVKSKPSSAKQVRPSNETATIVKSRPSPSPSRPASAKKSSDVTGPNDVPKSAPESPGAVDERAGETSGKNLTTSTTPDDDVSIVTLVEVSDSTKEVIEGAMKKFGMREMKTEGYWNVRWSDNGVSIQVCQKLLKFQRINRFPGSGLLMTKNNLAKHTNKMKQTFPEDYDFVPETWCLPGDISKVEQYAKAHDRDCFIVKPNDGSSGKGIIITRNITKLKTCEKMVCQVYIRKPYLIDGFKFDLRIYALMTSCKPLRLFVYNEGLARFATEPYEEPNFLNENNRYMHLTNYAVNKRSPSYTVNETKGTLRRLTTINKLLLRKNVDAKKVWESMDDAIVKTIISFLPALRHNYRVSFPEQTDSNSCFQIMGFDIIFDENLKPYVLEVNDSPSFKADVPLDKEMTESLIHDTFNILHLDENNRRKVLMEEKRQSRMRLMSSSVQNRNAIHKEKELNESLLTRSRVEWENSHMGNYRKVFPNDQKMKHYKKFIRESQEIFSNHI